MSAQQVYLNSRQCTGHMTSDMIMNYCRDWLRGMLHTTELDLVVGFAPESFFKQIWSPWLPPVWCPPWYDIHRGVWLSSGMHTAETDSLVWCTPQRLTPWCDAHHRDWLRGMMHTAEFDSVGCTLRKFLTIWRSLRIHRKIIQKYFSLLEAKMGSNHEQIEVKKPCDTLPLILGVVVERDEVTCSLCTLVMDILDATITDPTNEQAVSWLKKKNWKCHWLYFLSYV